MERSSDQQQSSLADWLFLRECVAGRKETRRRGGRRRIRGEGGRRTSNRRQRRGCAVGSERRSGTERRSPCNVDSDGRCTASRAVRRRVGAKINREQRARASERARTRARGRRRQRERGCAQEMCVCLPTSVQRACKTRARRRIQTVARQQQAASTRWDVGPRCGSGRAARTTGGTTTRRPTRIHIWGAYVSQAPLRKYTENSLYSTASTVNVTVSVS